MSNLDSSLDAILLQIGDFGKYQIFVLGMVLISVVMHSSVHVAYVFTAMDVQYRCTIPSCDLPENTDYKPPWLEYAVPYSENYPKKCQRYIPQTNDSSIYNCTKDYFDTGTIEKCDDFAFKTDERTILQEFDLYCEENLWKLTMVGTVNNIGQFFGLFISGIASDKIGRKLVLIWGMVLCAICGLLRTLVPSYEWYLFFEFLDAFFGSGTYACGFILGVELVGPGKRVLTSTLVSTCYAIGEVFAAGSAWAVYSWKHLSYILYTPPLFLILYTWIVPESIRWNLSRGNLDQAKQTLRKAAKVNGKTLSEDTLDKLSLARLDEMENKKEPLRNILKSTNLILRFINCCFCWMTCAFLFYGLTLNSVALDGNSYLDFILSSLVEIPAYFACAYFVDKVGRRTSQTASFFLTAASCLAFVFIPTDAEMGKLGVYLLGKFGATAAFTVCYVITSELFPTPLRHSIMGLCSTFGRIGSTIAPQTPLLAQIWAPFPLVLFSSMAVIAGFLTLLFPETLNIKLPDTIEEAEGIGKKAIQEAKS